MKRRAMALLGLMVACLQTGMAQTKCVVADMETRRPLKGARITTNLNISVETDYTGTCVLPAMFKSLTVSCYGYMRRQMNREEITDTVLLLPTMLNEVVIYGKAPKVGFDVKEAVKKSIVAGGRKPAGAGASFDFFRMFDKRVRRPSKKEREKNEHILKTY